MPVSEVLLDAGGDRALQGRLSAPVRGRHRRPAAGGGRGRAAAFPAWSTGCRCSIRASCRSPTISTTEREIGLDHLARDAVKARAALIGEHYEARLQPPLAGTSFGAAPYRAAAAGAALSRRAVASSGSSAALARLEFSTFGPPPRPPTGIDARSAISAGGRRATSRAERADRSVNLFDAIVAHLQRAGGRRRAAAARGLQRGHARAAAAGAGRSRLRHA